jgi:ChrR Cupin-like domain
MNPPPARTDPIDDRRVALLAGTCCIPESMRAAPAGVRAQLLERAAHSAAASQAFKTVRLHHAAATSCESGVRVRTLYASPCRDVPRPGEPLRMQCVELAAGACWHPGAMRQSVQREWLVMRGEVRAHDAALRTGDYRIESDGVPRMQELRSDVGALVYFREARVELGQCAPANIARAADASWEEYAPGIRRRVLWRAGTLGAFVFRALPGASVPMHRHRHDEECLMLEGELSIDDELLRAGDYQLAPAGTRHRSVET